MSQTSQKDDAPEATTDWRPMVSMLIVLGPPFIGILLLGWQLLTWLQTGKWPSLTFRQFVSGILSQEGSFLQWLSEPHSWYGLHKMTTKLFELPLTVWLLVIAPLIGGWLTSRWLDSKPAKPN